MWHVDSRTLRITQCNDCLQQHFETKEEAKIHVNAILNQNLNPAEEDYRAFDNEITRLSQLLVKGLSEAAKINVKGLDMTHRLRNSPLVVKNIRYLADEAREKISLRQLSRSDEITAREFLHKYDEVEAVYREYHTFALRYNNWARYYWSNSDVYLHLKPDCSINITSDELFRAHIATDFSGIPFQKLVADDSVDICHACFPAMSKVTRPEKLKLCTGSGTDDFTRNSQNMNEFYYRIVKCGKCRRQTRETKNGILRKHYV